MLVYESLSFPHSFSDLTPQYFPHTPALPPLLLCQMTDTSLVQWHHSCEVDNIPESLWEGRQQDVSYTSGPVGHTQAIKHSLEMLLSSATAI